MSNANPQSDTPVYTLTRTVSDQFHTAGKLTGPQLDRPIYTIEREWAQNRIGASCVPAGSYTVERYTAPRFGPCFILHNHSLGISRFPTPGVPRSGILIHAANFAFQLQGCIAPGLEYGPMVYQGTTQAYARFRNRVWPAVSNSVPAMQLLLQRLPATRFTLIIR